MFGDMYSQMMRARLGVGKPMEGYGGFNGPSNPGISGGPMGVPQQPQNGGVVPPWMQGGMWGMQHGPRTTPFQPRPEGGTIPFESPWNPRQTPYEPRPKDGGIEGGPFGPPHQQPSGPVDGGFQPSASGYMGGFKNPWQRF